ncbi:MAG: sigma-70 family RNA polymerase sigma factor [Erysipelotrichaceae bacterium]|nr:sigma-70 family RNA polymerase sigma factor [Erysipelotrichaceae bacterium]
MNWLSRLHSNDLSAFDEIYEETKKAVYYTIYFIVKDPDTSEDLMQETYLDFLQYKDKLKPDTDIPAFLVASSKNKAINYYNRHKKEKEFVSMLQNYSYANDRLLDTGLLEVVKSTLNEKECDIFLLHVIGEYTFKEISKMKKIPIGTLTWMYQEARKKLQSVLGGKNHV